MADVSIVVPGFNGDRFIEQVLVARLFRRGELEIIVVDERSTERSAAIVESTVERDDQVNLPPG